MAKKTLIEKTDKRKTEVKKVKKVLKEEKKPKTIKSPKPTLEKERYYEAVGRRKKAVAIVRLFTRGEKLFLVNKKPYNIYFPTLELQKIASDALRKMKCFDRFRILAVAKGGGLHGQAEALRHAIARALTIFNPDFKKKLRRAGYLTRDPRMRERKKFGLKRARRAPQWQKR